MNNGLQRPPALSHSVETAAAMLGLSRAYMYELITSGDIASFKSGKRRLVSQRAIEDYIAQQERLASGRR